MNNYNKGKGNYRKRSRSSDNDDDSITYHINEFGDKVYKKKKTSYQKPRANNYATRVTEDNHKKQDKRKKQSHYRNGKEHYKQNTGKKDDDRKPREARVKPRYPCGVCSETTHGNLLECPYFQKYIPGQPEGSTSTPKEVGLKCLGTVFIDCLHNSMRHYKKYFCNIEKRHFIVCKCRKHENAHDWMRVNYDPKKGVKNIDIMYNEIGANHIQINSIRVNESTKPK